MANKKSNKSKKQEEIEALDAFDIEDDIQEEEADYDDIDEEEMDEEEFDSQDESNKYQDDIQSSNKRDKRKDERVLYKLVDAIPVQEKPKLSERQLQFQNLTRMLVHEEANIRLKGLTKLARYFTFNATFEDLELLKIWKSLFLYVWAADKPLVQADINNRMSGFVLSIQEPSDALKYAKAFYKTMIKNWEKIDSFRMDKYLQLVRKMLSATMTLLEKNKKDEEKYSQLMGQMTNDLIQTVLSPENNSVEFRSNGITLHIADIYLEVLYKVTDGNIDPSHLNRYLLPFINFIAKSDDKYSIQRVNSRIFVRLITTYAPFGEKDNWETFNPDYIDEEGNPIPTIFPTDYDVVAKLLFKLASSKSTSSTNRKTLYRMQANFEKTAKKLRQLEEDAENVLEGSDLEDMIDQYGEEEEEEDEVETQQQQKQQVIEHPKKDNKRMYTDMDDDSGDDIDLDGVEDNEIPRGPSGIKKRKGKQFKLGKKGKIGSGKRK